jgi:hypothetical protein
VDSFPAFGLTSGVGTLPAETFVAASPTLFVDPSSQKLLLISQFTWSRQIAEL